MTLLKRAIRQLSEQQNLLNEEQQHAKEVFRRMEDVFNKVEDMIDMADRVGHKIEQEARDMRELGLGGDHAALVKSAEKLSNALSDFFDDFSDFMPGLEMQALGESVGDNDGDEEEETSEESIIEDEEQSETTYGVYVPANVYMGKYYEINTAPVIVLANSEKEASDIVLKNKDVVLSHLETKKARGGKRNLVQHPVKNNVFFDKRRPLRVKQIKVKGKALTANGKFVSVDTFKK